MIHPCQRNSDEIKIVAPPKPKLPLITRYPCFHENLHFNQSVQPSKRTAADFHVVTLNRKWYMRPMFFAKHRIFFIAEFRYIPDAPVFAFFRFIVSNTNQLLQIAVAYLFLFFLRRSSHFFSLRTPDTTMLPPKIIPIINTMKCDMKPHSTSAVSTWGNGSNNSLPSNEL